MGIVKFKFDKEKDLKNIWETANTRSHYGHDFKKGLTKNILKICKGKEYNKCRKELCQTVNSLHKNSLVNDVIESINKSWENIEKEYFKKLEKITKQKFPFKKVNAYLTTSSRCPYNPDPKNVSE